MLKTSLKRANSNCSGSGGESGQLNSNPDASENSSLPKTSVSSAAKVPKRSASLTGTTIQKMKTRSLSLTKTLSLRQYSPHEASSSSVQQTVSIVKSKGPDGQKELMRVDEVADDDDNVFMV